MPQKVPFATFVVLTAVAACTTPTGPLASTALRLEQPLPAPGASALRVASVQLYSDPFRVQAPASAVAGQPFDVSVTTYGGGCIGEDTTLVEGRAHGADVVPYQRVYRPAANGGCTMELRITQRQVHVLIAESGEATIRVIGRTSPGDSLVSAERTVSVR